MDMPNLEVQYLLVYEEQKKRKISADDKLNSLQTVFSLQNLFTTPTVFPRVSDWWKKVMSRGFSFYDVTVDTMSSIRISYNDTLTFEKNMLIGWDFPKNPFLKTNNNSNKIYFQ